MTMVFMFTGILWDLRSIYNARLRACSYRALIINDLACCHIQASCETLAADFYNTSQRAQVPAIAMEARARTPRLAPAPEPHAPRRPRPHPCPRPRLRPAKSSACPDRV